MRKVFVLEKVCKFVNWKQISLLPEFSSDLNSSCVTTFVLKWESKGVNLLYITITTLKVADLC